MSSTRKAAPGADPDESPERYLANGRLRGISIGMNIIARVARVLPEPERAAMIWLANYAKERDITADALSDELDLDKAEIRRALTDPDADRRRFCAAVDSARTAFINTLPALANTAVRRKIANAVRFAESSPQIVEVVGKTRTGKTESARAEYLARLDHAAWMHCPTGQWRDFVNELARALGVSAGSTSLKTGQLVDKLRACFGRNRIRLLFVDEGHRLWPTDLRTQPIRIEFLRDLWEQLNISVIILATPQYSESLSLAMEENPRWAPGQWDGRVQRYHCADTMSDADLGAVARVHLSAIGGRQDEPEAMIDQLVQQAKASEGFAGAMVKAIQRARFMAESESETMSLRHVKLAQAELARGTRLSDLSRSTGGKRGGKRP